jgi:hypothetical protein
VLEDVDGELLDAPGRDGGQRRVDLLERLELDALRVGQRGCLRRGRDRGRGGALDDRGRLTRALARESERADHEREDRDQAGQARAHHRPFALRAFSVGRRPWDAFSGVVVDVRGGRAGDVVGVDVSGHGAFLGSDLGVTSMIGAGPVRLGAGGRTRHA